MFNSSKKVRCVFPIFLLIIFYLMSFIVKNCGLEQMAYTETVVSKQQEQQQRYDAKLHWAQVKQPGLDQKGTDLEWAYDSLKNKLIFRVNDSYGTNVTALPNYFSFGNDEKPWGEHLKKENIEVEIREGIISVGSSCFMIPQVNAKIQPKSKIKKVSLPSSLQKIGSVAFAHNEAMEDLEIPDAVTKIDNLAFCNNVALKKVRLSNNLQHLGVMAFSGCCILEKVIIPDSLKKIAAFAFQNCSSLEEVILPTTLKEIGHAAFAFCTKLSKIKFPQGLEKIESVAFRNCTSLKKITIPSGVKYLGTQYEKGGGFAGCFHNCKRLQKITVYKPKDGINICQPQSNPREGVMYLFTGAPSGKINFMGSKDDFERTDWNEFNLRSKVFGYNEYPNWQIIYTE